MIANFTLGFIRTLSAPNKKGHRSGGRKAMI
jgi:hypothetical protein